MNIHYTPSQELTWYNRATHELAVSVLRLKLKQEPTGPEQARVERLQAVLDRIENDTFGYCIACDLQIEPDRLVADVTTKLCAKCAALRTV
ncbi:TraR/DksA family transcriptional regulator [Pelagibacterium montanilacus]|uniref:TraR/DksA family transcriptional regulator n=1 Tax=Pelagibacterium montanilacus TaxID=2185280 RepID=UPI003CCC5156